MDKEKQKRNRGSNFSKEEELLLLAEVEKFKNIIECKMTDKINSAEKSETWQKIVASFNSKNASHRNLEQLKVKYDNLKNKARKIAAGNKTYIRGTGGGPSLGGDADPAIEAVLRIINKKTVVGLQNPFDCDREDNNEMLIKDTSDNTNVTVLRIEELPCDEQVIIPSTSNVQHYENNIEHLNYNEQNSAVHEEQGLELENTVVENETQIQDIRTEAQKKRKGNWSKYTPKKLRTPMSRKLREIDNPFKEEYYKKKTELIEEEIKKNKLEQHHLTEKHLRDIEEHQKKMQLLEIEIKIKEQQLLKSNVDNF